MSAKLKSITIPDAETYRTLVDDLARLTDASSQLAALEISTQMEWTEIMDRHRDEYAILQTEISETEAAIKAVTNAHPEWFTEVKTLKTPYGSIGYRSATKLDVPNEEFTIALIELKGESHAVYLRPRKFLNLEALETLTDGELAEFKITRVTSDKCTVTPAKVDLGKAVKKAVESADAVHATA
ncbi:MAG: host-nuclease inhibitor Gam family protein [Luteolibacter sp.]|uniref:host-nuclease inhibitor Gam family protein n=1 Tax=Luteolibacter sp. TaxID=1962973 RepID=UPI003266A873